MCMGVSQNWGYLFGRGVPVIRIVVFGGLCGVPLFRETTTYEYVYIYIYIYIYLCCMIVETQPLLFRRPTLKPRFKYHASCSVFG